MIFDISTIINYVSTIMRLVPGDTEYSCNLVYSPVAMSAYGYERTLCHTLNDIRFSPESGHSEGYRKTSAFDPKWTFIGFFD